MATFFQGGLHRELKVTLVSASNLPKLRNWRKMKVYVQVSLNEIPRNTMRTSADNEGETNPKWNFVASYWLGERLEPYSGVNLVLKLFCKRSLGDKLIGKPLKLPLHTLFTATHGSEETISRSYPVEGTPEGKLSISYSFGEKKARNPTGTGSSSNWVDNINGDLLVS